MRISVPTTPPARPAPDRLPAPHRPRALFAMGRRHRDALFPPAAVERLARHVDLDPGLLVEDAGDFDRIADPASVELLVTSWGCPPLDAAALERLPALQAVVHAAGSVKHHVTEACWERGLRVSSAAAANAVPV